jgi:hypothetical protein
MEHKTPKFLKINEMRFLAAKLKIFFVLRPFIFAFTCSILVAKTQVIFRKVNFTWGRVLVKARTLDSFGHRSLTPVFLCFI